MGDMVLKSLTQPYVAMKGWFCLGLLYLYTIEDMGEELILQIAIVIVAILISMTIHEAMHAFVGHWLGDDTARLQGRLTLNPIAHIDPFMTILLPIVLLLMGAPIFGGAKPVPFNPLKVRYGEYGAALVAIAGPLTNLVLAFIVYGLLVILQPSGIVADALMLTVFVNLGFFIFNVLPIPPLDGSRVLYAFAPEPVKRGMETIERYGVLLVFAIVLLLSPVLGRFMGVAVNFFLNLFGSIFGVQVV